MSLLQGPDRSLPQPVRAYPDALSKGSFLFLFCFDNSEPTTLLSNLPSTALKACSRRSRNSALKCSQVALSCPQTFPSTTSKPFCCSQLLSVRADLNSWVPPPSVMMGKAWGSCFSFSTKLTRVPRQAQRACAQRVAAYN